MRSKLLGLLIAGATAITSISAQATDLTGAGSSFFYPVLAKWAEAYKTKSGVGLNYQSNGSSGGVKMIRAKTVDFAASDNPLKADELEKEGLVQFPGILGGVVPVVNLPGFKPGQLKIDGETLADVFAGKITKWNDAKIASLNPGIKLPAADITVAHRADGSGTTAIFTNYLSKVSKDWAGTVGEGASVKWPAASSVGGKGNEGVSANVARVEGAIGYVEYAYAKKNNLTFLQMKNHAGKFVMPKSETFAAAAAGVKWENIPGMGTFLTDSDGANSWPIAGASFIIMYKNADNKATSAEVLKFFDWAFKNGGKMAQELDYVPMPANVTGYIAKNVWSSVQK